MNISLENIDKGSGLLTLKIEKADYQPLVDQQMKQLRGKAQVPGFRKGMVPASLIKKMYGKSVLAEQVQKLVSDNVFKYLKDNDIAILGEPMPNEDKQQPIDFDTMEDFEFLFDLALVPPFEVPVSDKDEVNYYTIEVTDEVIDAQVAQYTQRSGKYDKVDNYQDKDMVKGVLVQLDENGSTKEGGVEVEDAVLMPEYMENDEQKALFAGAKVNDIITFNPNKAFNGSEAEIASLLKIEKEEVAGMTSDFSLQIQEITRFVPGDLNQELFDQVFGEGVVNSEEEFRNKIKETIAGQYAENSDYRFMLDVQNTLLEKTGDLEYSEPMLKRIMDYSEPEKELTDEDFQKSVKALTWHLIKEKLAKEYEVKVEEADVMNMAKEIARAQFAQYGMMTVPDEMVENYAKSLFKEREGIDRIVGRVVESKLADILKTKVTLKPQTISMEDFSKLFE